MICQGIVHFYYIINLGSSWIVSCVFLHHKHLKCSGIHGQGLVCLISKKLWNTREFYGQSGLVLSYIVNMWNVRELHGQGLVFLHQKTFEIQWNCTDRVLCFLHQKTIWSTREFYGQGPVLCSYHPHTNIFGILILTIHPPIGFAQGCSVFGQLHLSENAIPSRYRWYIIFGGPHK